jgi:hypothetical protein
MDAGRGATTVEGYLAKLPPDRREAIAKVREVVNENLPDGYEEGIQYGAISWYIPLSRFPVTYNGQPLAVASLASQKSHMALYLMSVYGHRQLEAWFRGAFQKAGKKLDMGKSCVRFRSLDALPLDVIGETIRRVPVDTFISYYEDARAGAKRAQASAHAARSQPARSNALSSVSSSPGAIRAPRYIGQEKMGSRKNEPCGDWMSQVVRNPSEAKGSLATHPRSVRVPRPRR